MRTRIAIVLSTLALCAVSGTYAEGWPAYRGPNADGALRETVFKPGEEVGLRVGWKRQLGSGYSSVSVAGSRALTMFSDGEQDVLIAFDEQSGLERWRVELGPTYIGHDGSHDGPMSTPLVSDGRVFALGPRGQLLAVSLDSGETLWEVALTEDLEAKKPHYGFSTGPLVIDGILIVQIGAGEGSAIAGFDPATGEKLWQALDDTIDYQSPVPFPVGERTMMMAVGKTHLSALDPRDGTVFWSFAHEGEGARGVASLMPVLAEEGRVFLAHKDDSSRAIRIGHSDEGVTFEPLWENNAIRNSYNVAVYHEGHIYAFSSRFLTCVDVETGEAKWKSRAPGDGFLVLVDGHLVILTKEGSFHLAKASPERYQEVASVDVFDHISWGPPGYADGSFYVRSLEEVARIDLVFGRGSQMAAATKSADVTGTQFGKFLASLDAAEDRQAAVDAYLAEQETFPIVEGDDLVHFVYAGEGTDLAFAGDLIGSRQETPMVKVDGTNFHYYSARLEPDARVAYVFVRDFEEILDPRNPNKHMSSVYGKDMEMIFDPSTAIWMSWVGMPEWQSPSYLEDAPEEKRGTFESRQIEVADLENPVSLSIYLPHGYAEDTDRRYPVAYVAGGSMIQQVGKFGPTLDNLINNRIEPIIAVFYDVPVPPFQMQKVGPILTGEIVPYLDENFRTVASAEGRAAVGADFPAYGSMMAAFGQPQVFGNLGVVSPMIFGSMRGPLEAMIPEAAEGPSRVFVTYAKYGMRNPHENWDMRVVLTEFTDLLRNRGYELSGGEVPDGAGWSAHRNHTDEMLEALFPMGGSSGGQ